ncbi:flagellar hook basal-body protein [Ramlibacter sp. PS3R-8]|uniref:flagellar hook-basal body protein n=1 Tax=Ramlibacter sp. PS3R-8 TaxID=3133437 RepID=UPI003099AF98
MNEILSLVLGSMQSDVSRLERIGMNITNASTTGYKREIVAAMPFAARMGAAAAVGAVGTAEPAPLSVHFDPRPGTLKATGQSLDLAVGGPGWFEVASDQGATYTRQGNFRVDARGRLVTQQGHPVMGTAGEIQMPAGQAVIDASGRIFDPAAPAGAGRAQAVAQLKVVQFEGGAPMDRAGDGRFRIGGDAAAVPESLLQVQQGFLENSNVSHMHEMVRLMETMRHMETMQKVAIGYDDMLATSIRKLGEGS